MSGRNRYLVAYDISDDKRLRRVHKCMKKWGYALQYSVFLCDVDDRERVEMISDLWDEIHHAVDRVVVVDLGPTHGRGAECFEFLGVRPTTLPSTASRIL